MQLLSFSFNMTVKAIIILILCQFTIIWANFPGKNLQTLDEVFDFLADTSKNRVFVLTTSEKICPGAVFWNG